MKIDLDAWMRSPCDDAVLRVDGVGRKCAQASTSSSNPALLLCLHATSKGKADSNGDEDGEKA